jgi:carboxyl-terminal processing protease
MSCMCKWIQKLKIIIILVLIVFATWAQPAQALTEEQNLLSEAWRIVDRAYVDGTFNHQNWWQVRQQALAKGLPDREATYAAIQAMLGRLDDPFTRLLKPDQYRGLQTTTSGELTGVGLQVALDASTGELEVIAPIVGSPAEQAGIQPRDHILEINGTPTKSLTLDESAERMRGVAGTTVTLLVRHQSSSSEEIPVVRGRISLNPVTAEVRPLSEDFKVGYLRLNQFNANATMEVAHAIKRLENQGAKGYILDLRNNPGGLLQAGIEVARLWLDDGAIVYTVNRQGVLNGFEATGKALTQAPLAVLINQGTASASEILAGALQDQGRAKLVGETTFGKGLIQSLFELSDGSGLAVTVARYETPNHRDINRQGIQPDIRIKQDAIARDQIGTETDLQYQAAIDSLTHHSVLAGAA